MMNSLQLVQQLPFKPTQFITHHPLCYKGRVVQCLYGILTVRLGDVKVYYFPSFNKDSHISNIVTKTATASLITLSVFQTQFNFWGCRMGAGGQQRGLVPPYIKDRIWGWSQKHGGEIPIFNE